jgi:hypothetical protein
MHPPSLPEAALPDQPQKEDRLKNMVMLLVSLCCRRLTPRTVVDMALL